MPKIEKMRILSPLDLQGIILSYLRNIFSTKVINGLVWSENSENRTIAIEVADKDDPELFNIKPAIFISIGSINFSFTSIGADVHSIKPKAAEIQEDGTKIMSYSSKDQIISQSFPVKIAFYSSKTEAYQLSYITAKLMLAFRQALERESNLRTISNFSVSPPQWIKNLDGDVYRSELNLTCEFLDVERIIDVAPLIKVSYLEVKSKNSETDAFDTSKELWVDEADAFFNDED